MGRLVAALAVVVLVAVACTNNEREAEITPQPTGDTSGEQVAEFQLVGTIEKAFASVEAPVDAASDHAAISGPTTEPSATPVGDSPSVPGVLRMTVEDANEELTDGCGVDEGTDALVYWTTDTSFDPSDVLDETETELEEGLEDRVAGISGRVFRTGDDDLDTPEPDVSDPGCVLVADQVGFEQADAAATQAPSVPRTTPASTPTETDEPTAEPDETKKPKKTPLASATPTALQLQDV